MSEMPPPNVPPSTPPPPGGSYTPPPAGGGPAPGSDRTLMVVLSYLWILALIPLLTKKEDPDVQWHAKNGLALFGVEIAFWIVTIIAGQFVPGMLGCGLATIECAIWIGFLVLRVILIVKGVGGQRMRIPVVTDLAEKM
ncbi:MAG TPA: DUF4870 domain-containing protein [Thermoanaerobaculia bacterium]|nr:DUF4870 domain-containing protein [Thermoanaerobaculia bacterium]